MRRLFYSLGLAAIAVTFVPAPAHAQQAFNFYIGGFSPRGLDSRDVNDVLLNDTAFLDYDFKGFNAGTIGAEWLVNLGSKAEAGLGVGFYQHTEHAFDAFEVAPIEADLKLRMIPFTATLRYLPMGHGGPVEPYIGAGITAISWRYSEIGDFVATDGTTIVHGRFTGTGGAVGPVILAGIRFPVGAAASIGGEARYQSARGDLPNDQFFATAPGSSTSRIDLGGFSYLLTFHLKF